MVGAVRGPGLVDDDLLALREPVRRYLARLVDDPHERQDLEQEALARVWEARRRVDPSAAVPYALATARHLALSAERERRLHGRHQHRLVEPGPLPPSDEPALRREEHLAAAAALSALPEPDREALHARYLREDDASTTSATRLARARARLRVDYLLALRHLSLPTARCRPVLEALSSGDRRLQQRLQVGHHLLACPTCADCAPALLARRRGMFGLLPVPLLLAWLPLRRAYARAPRTTVATSAVAVAAVAVGAVLLLQQPGAGPAAAPAPPTSAAPALPTPAAPAAGQVTLAGRLVPAARWGTGAVTARPGAQVLAVDVPVQAVPADEGFWVGDAAARFWVQLAGPGESPQHVETGDRVTFTGTVAAYAPDSTPGLTDAEGRPVLQQEGGLVAVDTAALQVRPG